MIAKKEEEKIKEFINKASERNISINSENQATICCERKVIEKIISLNKQEQNKLP